MRKPGRQKGISVRRFDARHEARIQELIEKYQPEHGLPERGIRTHVRKKRDVRIICLENPTVEFTSAADAARWAKAQPSAVSRSLYHHNAVGGFHFRLGDRGGQLCLELKAPKQTA